jgi:hypothetical protein
MRCPNCGDEYEDGVLRCADCAVPLVDQDAVLEPVPPTQDDARLGRFHPAVGELIAGMLDRRSIAHTVRVHDDEVEVLVDRSWRDDLRTEFALSWGELVRGLDEAATAELRELGGDAPGWFDAPRGGYVDRTGKMVVEVEDEDRDADASRVIGPALLAGGVILAITGWYLVSSPGIVVAGLALALVGLLVPR